MVLYFFLFLFQWQQRVSYKLDVKLDVEEHSLIGVEYLTYYNNSPYQLETLYVHLYANAYKNLNTVYAQETRKLGNYGEHKFLKSKESERGYIDVKSVTLNDEPLKFEIDESNPSQEGLDETIMAIISNGPIEHGDSIKLKIDFYLKIPKQFSRLGYKNDHYEIVQWYPKVCVFDEDGWHRDSYHAIGEFYGEYGSFDVNINLPGDYIVAATGERIDETDIKFIESLIDSGEKIDMGDRKTVRFYAENVHDFAWVCDPNFLVKKFEVDSINIYVYYLKKNEKGWKNTGPYAMDAVKRYNQWYGKYPYKNLSIVDGSYPSAGGMEYPNLVIISIVDDWLTRLFEVAVIHEIGHQWFYGVLGFNELDETWLDEGLTTYTEMRYFEDKYGEKNSLIKLNFIPPIQDRFYHKLVYYVTRTNKIEKPVLTPAYEFIDTPIAYGSSEYSKPALFLFSLEKMLGKDLFDKILKRFFKEYKFRHPKTEDFIRICEEESEQDLKLLFAQFLNTTDFCDWSIKKIKGNSVEIENKGDLIIPVDVLIEGKNKRDTFKIATKNHTIVLPEDFEKIKRVAINPDGHTFESNYWNNYYPRKFKIKPIFALPTLDSYLILYLPYLWYGTHDGITTGLYLLGTEFADFDFFKGRHQWTAGCVYGLRSKKFYPSFSYQTPIFFERGIRTRIMFKGSNSNDEYKFSFGFINNLGIPFSNVPSIEITNMISYYRLNSYALVDSIDWDFGRNVIFDNHFKFSYRKWKINVGVSFANENIGSDWNYLKTSFEIKKQFDIFVPFNLRVFAGKILGDAPTQEKFFLSGALRISILADLLFSQKGYASPQEHLHIFGDGNMLGYQTMHIKSDELYCINLELPAKFPIRLFVDYGYNGRYVADFGARIVLGPISFNVPLYAKTDEPWELRWSIGL